MLTSLPVEYKSIPGGSICSLSAYKRISVEELKRMRQKSVLLCSRKLTFPVKEKSE